jgi:hypothetical protein
MIEHGEERRYKSSPCRGADSSLKGEDHAFLHADGPRLHLCRPSDHEVSVGHILFLRWGAFHHSRNPPDRGVRKKVYTFQESHRQVEAEGSKTRVRNRDDKVRHPSDEV